jgi:hypothetical protein
MSLVSKGAPASSGITSDWLEAGLVAGGAAAAGDGVGDGEACNAGVGEACSCANKAATEANKTINSRSIGDIGMKVSSPSSIAQAEEHRPGAEFHRF